MSVLPAPVTCSSVTLQRPQAAASSGVRFTPRSFKAAEPFSLLPLDWEAGYRAQRGTESAANRGPARSLPCSPVPWPSHWAPLALQRLQLVLCWVPGPRPAVWTRGVGAAGEWRRAKPAAGCPPRPAPAAGPVCGHTVWARRPWSHDTAKLGAPGRAWALQRLSRVLHTGLSSHSPQAFLSGVGSCLKGEGAWVEVQRPRAGSASEGEPSWGQASPGPGTPRTSASGEAPGSVLGPRCELHSRLGPPASSPKPGDTLRCGNGVRSGQGGQRP